ncbi:lipoprotein [Chitinibacter sp. GC72]|uniref:LPS translocon maturation chaperone LptM n=1 Tax=Chitinibacter sp. GC72 TaxID=1526917 RepID=UPI0018DFE6DF
MLNCNFAITCLIMRALIVFICVASLLTACGFKGPLYLPQTPASDSPKPASSTASMASSAAVDSTAIK